MRKSRGKYYLPEMTRREVQEVAERAILLIPIATIEQHGPHLPMHTDMDNCEALVRGVVEKLQPGLPVYRSVSFWYAPAGAGAMVGFPGALWLRKEIFKEVLNDHLLSYLRGGFKKIVLISGHGGGTHIWIPEVVRNLRKRVADMNWSGDWQVPADARVITFNWLAFLAEFAASECARIRKNPGGSDWHGGDVETALQLYLRPELVDMSQAKKGTIQRPTRFGASDIFNWNRQLVIEGYPSKSDPGEVDRVYGDPTLATRELGRRVYRLAVRKMAELVEEFASL